MEAKKISQRAVKSMINSNITLLHIGNFETGKRTNLKVRLTSVYTLVGGITIRKFNRIVKKSNTYHFINLVTCLR